LTPAQGSSRGERLPLAGDWKYRAGCAWPRDGLPRRPSPRVSPAAANGAPGALYNGMLAPIAGFPVKGVLWYQGESNAERAKQYETLFPLLIRTWRKAWGQDFAFLWVQLPNFLEVRKAKDRTPLAPGLAPDDLPLGWAAVREVQSRVLSVPQTGMAVTIDIGQTWDIHPNNKKTVAERLALIALGQVYGKDVAYSGPVYDSMSVEGDQVRLRFRHAAGGLVAKGGPLRQFAIAGEDRKFVWAQAKIVPPASPGQAGDAVLMSEAGVKKPFAVRYAFCADPQGANLCNAAGLPASPFRTDDWELAPPAPKK
jgi:sialate O-acetylesterase